MFGGSFNQFTFDRNAGKKQRRPSKLIGMHMRCTVKFSVSIRFNWTINRRKLLIGSEKHENQKFGTNPKKRRAHTHAAFCSALTRTYDAFSMYFTQLHTINQTAVIKLSKIQFFSSRTRHVSRDSLKRVQLLSAALCVYMFSFHVFFFFSSYHFRRTALELISLIASSGFLFRRKKGS